MSPEALGVHDLVTSMIITIMTADCDLNSAKHLFYLMSFNPQQTVDRIVFALKNSGTFFSRVKPWLYLLPKLCDLGQVTKPLWASVSSN